MASWTWRQAPRCSEGGYSNVEVSRCSEGGYSNVEVPRCSEGGYSIVEVSRCSEGGYSTAEEHGDESLPDVTDVTTRADRM